MDFFKNRRTAIAIFVVTVIVFSLIGFRLSFAKACDRIELAFYDRSAITADDVYGYYSAPASHLNYCARYANRLLAIVSDHVPQELYDNVYKSRTALLDALSDGDVSDMHDAYTALNQAVAALHETADTTTFDSTTDDYDTVYADYISASQTAAESGYNDYVDEFIRNTANRFPTGILCRLTGIELPEKFE